MRFLLRLMFAALAIAPVLSQAVLAVQTASTPPLGEIHGRVVDRDGGVLPGAEIAAVRIEPVARPIIASAVAANSGRFTLANLRPGRYFLVASLNGFDNGYGTVELKEGSVEMPPIILPVTGICECLGKGIVVKNPEGQGVPGAEIFKEGAKRALTSWGRLDSQGRSRFGGLWGGEMVVIDAPGYGRHRLRLEVVRPSDPDFTVTLNVAPELIAAAAESFSQPMPDLSIGSSEVVFGVATTTGDFTIAVDSARAPATTAGLIRFVEAGLRGQTGYRVLTGDDVVREIQQRPVKGRKTKPPVTVIAIKPAR